MSVRSTLGAVHLVLALLGGLAVVGNSIQKYVRSTRTPTAAMLFQTENEKLRTEITHYKEWKLVNPAPQRVDPALSASCSRPLPVVDGGPHEHKYISVYVNSIGADAMLHQRKPVFPEGSIIVKEKLNDLASKEPELLTVMRKREPGYNASSGDWEYLVLDGKAANITDRGQLASCNSCHTAYKSTDFITRAYLPRETRNELK